MADAEDAPGTGEPAEAPAEDTTAHRDGEQIVMEGLQACDVISMAKDKYKCRSMQQCLMSADQEDVQWIASKVEPEFLDLVLDQYGNYFCQKVLEVVTSEQFDRFFGVLQEHLRDLSGHVQGTRAVQKLAEQAILRGKAAQLLEVLPDNFQEELTRSMTGFHVMVKMVELLPSKEVELLCERLCGTPEKAFALATDQWGCCVLKKCLDRAEGAVKSHITDAVTTNSLSLVQDPYGNYVVQHLIAQNNQVAHPPGLVWSTVTRIVDALKGNIFDLCQQKFSSNVLEKCLLHSSEQDRTKIVNEILSPPSCRPSEGVRLLLFHQYGNYVFQRALDVSKEPQFSLLLENARQPVQEMVRSATSGMPLPEAEAGKLPPEQCHRLGLKLAKRFPGLVRGTELEMFMYRAYPDGMEGFGGCLGWGDVQTSAAMYGYPFCGWDPNFGPYPIAYPPEQGRKGGRGGNAGRKAGGSERKSSRSRANGAGEAEAAAVKAYPGIPFAAAGEQNTMRVGRIVGFWPNYSVTYDEVPMSGTSRGSRGGRCRNKSSGRAATTQAGAGGDT